MSSCGIISNFSLKSHMQYWKIFSRYGFLQCYYKKVMENKNFTQSMIIPIEKRKMDVGFGSKSQLKIDEK